MNATKETKTFIANLVDKNYSQANANLQKMVEYKIKERVQRVLAPKK